jgi:ATP-dependent RNA circularization protein (DNA/RNA ligase family)
METLFDREKLINYFHPEGKDVVPVTIYGEGYGAKIQKGGNYIKNGVDFILFDIKVGKWWLNRESCEMVAADLGLKIVPLIGMMTIQEAIEYVRQGFKSTIAENKDYDAEGLVLKTPDGLLRRNGERLITKIKTADFRKYDAVYGKKPKN